MILAAIGIAFLAILLALPAAIRWSRRPRLAVARLRAPTILACRLIGHSWDQQRDECNRCLRTAEAIRRGRVSRRELAIRQREDAAYWRGVADGRKVDRRRAYRLGYRRGWDASLRSLLDRLDAR